MNRKFSYTKAIDQINKILSDIEQGELDVDQLSEEVRKAIKLIGQCKDKLRETEESLKRSFKDSSQAG